MRKLALALLIATAPVAPALAHDHDWPEQGDLTIEQAIEIAYAQGISVLREVQFDDGRWEIEGINESGAQIEFEIDGVTGDIIQRR